MDVKIAEELPSLILAGEQLQENALLPALSCWTANMYNNEISRSRRCLVLYVVQGDVIHKMLQSHAISHTFNACGDEGR